MQAGQCSEQGFGLSQQRHLILAYRPRPEPAFLAWDHPLSDQEMLQRLDPSVRQPAVALSLSSSEAVLEGVLVAGLPAALARFVRRAAADGTVASGGMRCRGVSRPHLGGSRPCHG